jgi:hypothetical protein
MLFVYDCNIAPISVGDVLVYLHYAKCLAKIKGTGKITFMFLYSAVGYKPSDPCFNYLNSDNILKELMWLAQIPAVDIQVTDVVVGTEIPSGYDEVIHPGIYMYYDIFKNYVNHDRVAGIEWRQCHTDTALKLLTKRNIVLCLRRNTRQAERNTDVKLWIEVIDELKLWDRLSFVGDYRYKYPELSDTDISFTKDECYTTLATDLALVANCRLYLGGCTGPCELRRMYDLPAVFTEYPIDLRNEMRNVVQYRIGENTDSIIDAIRRFI